MKKSLLFQKRNGSRLTFSSFYENNKRLKHLDWNESGILLFFHYCNPFHSPPLILQIICALFSSFKLEEQSDSNEKRICFLLIFYQVCLIFFVKERE